MRSWGRESGGRRGVRFSGKRKGKKRRVTAMEAARAMCDESTRADQRIDSILWRRRWNTRFRQSRESDWRMDGRS